MDFNTQYCTIQSLFSMIKQNYSLTLRPFQAILLGSKPFSVSLHHLVSPSKLDGAANRKGSRRVAFAKTLTSIMARLRGNVYWEMFCRLCFVLEDEKKRRARAPHFIFHISHVELRLRSGRTLTIRRGLSL